MAPIFARGNRQRLLARLTFGREYADEPGYELQGPLMSRRI